jgi:hypothetical protein
MDPVKFPEANARLGPPATLDESQCLTIDAFVGKVQGGSVDGSDVFVVAWKPTPEELGALAAGKTIFVSCLGGIPPHFLSTDFETATHPA